MPKGLGFPSPASQPKLTTSVPIAPTPRVCETRAPHQAGTAVHAPMRGTGEGFVREQKGTGSWSAEFSSNSALSVQSS